MIPTSIDGTDITGATIDGTDVQEITVDGQTVFSATPPIPSSAIHHWKIDEGSGTTVADSVGSADGTINGATWDTGTYVGGAYLDFDGSNDDVDTTTLGNFGSNMFSEFAVALTFKTTQNEGVFLSAGTQFNSYFAVHIGSANLTGNIDGSIGFFLADDSGNQSRAGTDSTFNDGTNHRVVVQKASNGNANDFEFFVDTNSESFTVQGNDISSDNFSNLGANLKFGDRGDDNSRYDGLLDDVIITDSKLSSSEIQDDFDRQPWS